MVDTFNNEIIAHSVTNVTGSNKPYYKCLEQLNQLAGKKEEQKPPVILHTDQGAVYSSKGFEYAITYFVPCREGELQQIIQ